MKILFFTSGLLWLLLSSCRTYFISTESLKQQWNGQLEKEVTVLGPVGGYQTYKTSVPEIIVCTDERGKEVMLEMRPSLEIRITDSNNKRTQFYVDQLIVQDTLLSGRQSRILASKQAIPLNSIKKIEIQDGRKNYRYK